MDHLSEFARSRRGVEAFVEPRTTVTDTTVVLVAHDGEWTRRRVAAARAAHDLAASWVSPRTTRPWSGTRPGSRVDRSTGSGQRRRQRGRFRLSTGLGEGERCPVAGTLKIRSGEGRVVATVRVPSRQSGPAADSGRWASGAVLDNAGPTILPPLCRTRAGRSRPATLSYGALIGRFRGVLFPASLLIIAAVIGVEGIGILLAGDVRLFAVPRLGVGVLARRCTDRAVDRRRAHLRYAAGQAAVPPVHRGHDRRRVPRTARCWSAVTASRRNLLIVGQAVFTLAGGLALWRVGTGSTSPVDAVSTKIARYALALTYVRRSQ